MSSVICGPYSTTESLITPWLCSTKVAKTSPRHLKQRTTMNNLELRPERCIVLIHGTLVWEMSLSITPVQRQLLFFSWGCLIYKKQKQIDCWKVRCLKHFRCGLKLSSKQNQPFLPKLMTCLVQAHRLLQERLRERHSLTSWPCSEHTWARLIAKTQHGVSKEINI